LHQIVTIPFINLSAVRNFGLIGASLTHSFSKDYFRAKFVKENIPDATYDLYPLHQIADLPGLIRKTPGLLGLNVTLPYKESVIPLLDELDETAQSVGAVNTILITHTSSDKPVLKGFNTDIFGFRQSIKPFLESHHERALILGTGGASKAVAHVLKEIGVDCYFVSRKNSQDLPKNESRRTYFGYAEVTEYVIRHFPLIINTTPLGMYPDVHVCPSLPYEFLTSAHFLIDLIYNPDETRFLAEGRKRGAMTLNGLSMLHQQAEKAWLIWNTIESQ
jgi:shikimate dehydrogenase